MTNKLKDKTLEYLRKEISEGQEKLRVIRFGGAGSRSRNVKEGRNLRREVARGLTELRARAIDDSKRAIALKPKKA